MRTVNTNVNYTIAQQMELCEELKTCSLEQLEERILKRWKVSKAFDYELKAYLDARIGKIDDAFEWTPDNMEKLLRLNQKLLDCFEKIKAEAEPIIKTLQKRIDRKDGFFHDFGIEAHIYPEIHVPDDDGNLCEPDDGIYRILMDSLHDNPVLNIYNIEKMEDFNRKLYFNKKLNWNIGYLLTGRFSEHYISYGIHELYDHTCWSSCDILKINHLWTELRVIQQKYEEV